MLGWSPLDNFKSSWMIRTLKKIIKSETISAEIQVQAKGTFLDYFIHKTQDLNFLFYSIGDPPV